MGDITGANATVFITVTPLFPVPQQIQGFAPDSVFSFPAIESIETMMGVDGILSAGFVWKVQQMTIDLMADSPSNAIFDTWHLQQEAGQQSYPANGIVLFPALSLKLIMTNGYLGNYKLPDVKKLVQPRQYTITWNQVVPAPA